MKKTLITYFSKTGNTKKIAEAIHESIKGEKIIKPINELLLDELKEYTLIFVGFPVYSHSVPYAVENFLRIIPKDKKVAFFSTHGSLTGSTLSRQALEYATTLVAQSKVLATYSCRGQISRQAIEFLQNSPEHNAWTEMAVSATNHPDESDVEDAKSFARWVMLLSKQK